jgi:hypothetical protein
VTFSRTVLARALTVWANKTRRGMRQGKLNELPASRCLVCGVHGGSRHLLKVKRLSATDISALASMKNVAKCDTWCELQNPVNHRVFERKLRPKPLGLGHVCLGVSHRVAPSPLLAHGRERILASRALMCVAGPNDILRRCMARPVVVEISTRMLS